MSNVWKFCVRPYLPSWALLVLWLVGVGDWVWMMVAFVAGVFVNALVVHLVLPSVASVRTADGVSSEDAEAPANGVKV